MNHTKIIATLGPATDSQIVLESILRQGVNLVRLNFSHGTKDEHIRRAQMVEAIAKKSDLNVAILADLQGPKIRISRFKEGSVNLVKGGIFTLSTEIGSEDGDEEKVGIRYPSLVKDCKVGDILLLDDGLIKIRVESIDDFKLICRILEGGVLRDNKGINLQHGGLSAAALTTKDKADIKTIASIGVDYVAISFVRSAADIEQARELLLQEGCHAHLIAKIERFEALDNPDHLAAIIRASDGLMVARGDLGVEVGDAELVGIQKMLINRARELNKVVIIATQMMESMVYKPSPTRAEVMDVANAVLDGTDAVMLSAETAIGNYPTATIAAMSRIIAGAEKHQSNTPTVGGDIKVNKADEAIALATMYVSSHLKNLAAIICFTSSGNTPLLISRTSCKYPVYAFSSALRTHRRMALYRHVYPLQLPVIKPEMSELQVAINALKKKQMIRTGDYVMVTYGDISGTSGGTNNMKILQIGDEH